MEADAECDTFLVIEGENANGLSPSVSSLLHGQLNVATDFAFSKARAALAAASSAASFAKRALSFTFSVLVGSTTSATFSSSDR